MKTYTWDEIKRKARNGEFEMVTDVSRTGYVTIRKNGREEVVQVSDYQKAHDERKSKYGNAFKNGLDKGKREIENRIKTGNTSGASEQTEPGYKPDYVSSSGAKLFRQANGYCLYKDGKLIRKMYGTSLQAAKIIADRI